MTRHAGPSDETHAVMLELEAAIVADAEQVIDRYILPLALRAMADGAERAVFGTGEGRGRYVVVEGSITAGRHLSIGGLSIYWDDGDLVIDHEGATVMIHTETATAGVAFTATHSPAGEPVRLVGGSLPGVEYGPPTHQTPTDDRAGQDAPCDGPQREGAATPADGPAGGLPPSGAVGAPTPAEAAEIDRAWEPVYDAEWVGADGRPSARVPVISTGQGTSRVDVYPEDLDGEEDEA